MAWPDLTLPLEVLAGTGCHKIAEKHCARPEEVSRTVTLLYVGWADSVAFVVGSHTAQWSGLLAYNYLTLHGHLQIPWKADLVVRTEGVAALTKSSVHMHLKVHTSNWWELMAYFARHSQHKRHIDPRWTAKV